MVAVNIRDNGQRAHMWNDGFTQEYVSTRISELGQKCEVTNYSRDGNYGIFGVWIEDTYRILKLPKVKKPFNGFSW